MTYVCTHASRGEGAWLHWRSALNVKLHGGENSGFGLHVATKHSFYFL